MKDWIGNFALSRPVSNCLKPLYHNESSFDTIHMKMRFFYRIMFMQIKVIFKGFARGLVLKQRHKITRKCPNICQMLFLHLTYFLTRSEIFCQTINDKYTVSFRSSRLEQFNVQGNLWQELVSNLFSPCRWGELTLEPFPNSDRVADNTFESLQKLYPAIR